MKNLTFSLATILVIGCKPQVTRDNAPDFVPTPTAVSFNACPSRDENNMPVAGVFPELFFRSAASRSSETSNKRRGVGE